MFVRVDEDQSASELRLDEPVRLLQELLSILSKRFFFSSFSSSTKKSEIRSRSGQIGDWLNHFDVEQSKAFDQMVEKRLSPSVPPLNFGLSPEQKDFLYEFDRKRKAKETS